MVKNPPANAGDTGSSNWSGKIPHAAEQLSPCATTTEPVLRNKRSHRNEKAAHRNEE